MAYLVITWQTHEGGGGNPPRIARDKFSWSLEGWHDSARKRDGLRENGIEYTFTFTQED